MDMNAIEADVDAAIGAAARVGEARERALAVKDCTMLIAEQDPWVLYKTAKGFLEEAEQAEREAQEAYVEAGSRLDAVEKATKPHEQANALAALAQETARRAFEQADRDMKIVSQLVSEVTQNCKDACKYLG